MVILFENDIIFKQLTEKKTCFRVIKILHFVYQQSFVDRVQPHITKSKKTKIVVPSFFATYLTCHMIREIAVEWFYTFGPINHMDSLHNLVFNLHRFIKEKKNTGDTLIFQIVLNLIQKRWTRSWDMLSFLGLCVVIYSSSFLCNWDVRSRDKHIFGLLIWFSLSLVFKLIFAQLRVVIHIKRSVMGVKKKKSDL